MSKQLYRPDIDGLRAIAVLAVVINHLSPALLPGGYVGVDIFFVISGYLITSILLAEVETGRIDIKRFYERRVRRIIPALFAMLLAVVVAGWFVLLPSDYLSTLKALASTVFFGSNIFFWRDAAEGYFAATDASLNPLLHTWSLGVEEQFYMAFPVFVLVAYRYARRQFKALLLLAALCSLLLAEWLLSSMGKGIAVFFLTPFRAWELLAGSLLAAGVIPAVQSRAGRELLSLAGLAAIAWSLITYSDKTTFPGFAALFPVMGSAAIIYAGMSGGSRVASLLSLRPVVFIGLISYSLYLWHWPIIVYSRYYWGLDADNLSANLNILIVSFVVSALSWIYIERPFRFGCFYNKKLYGAMFLFSLLFISVSSIGYYSSGFKDRVTEDVLIFEKIKSQKIPFLKCHLGGSTIDNPCMLGESTKNPATVLLFGDSHMLAWAPALDAVYKSRNEKAYFFPKSACPPLFYLEEYSNRQNCLEQLQAIKRFIERRPEIDTVVLAAFWSLYTRNSAHKLVAFDKEGAAATQEALSKTLAFLVSKKIHVVLIGPVPTFDKHVPHNLATSILYRREPQKADELKQYQLNAEFFDVVKEWVNNPDISFFDPIDWMCTPVCKTHDGHIVFYRDHDHLSSAGALLLKDKIIY